MQFLTDFADQAVVLPVAVAAALVFAWSRWWRGLSAWLIAVGGVLGVILVLKVAFAACGDGAGLESPSGHTASACIVYGGIAWLLLRGRMPTFLLALIPAAIAAVFAASRLALQVHTPADVIVGGIVGMGGIGVLAGLAGPAPPRQNGALAIMALLVVVLHGSHLPAEQAIRSFAQNLGQVAWLGAAGCRAG